MQGVLKNKQGLPQYRCWSIKTTTTSGYLTDATSIKKLKDELQGSAGDVSVHSDEGHQGRLGLGVVGIRAVFHLHQLNRRVAVHDGEGVDGHSRVADSNSVRVSRRQNCPVALWAADLPV